VTPLEEFRATVREWLADNLSGDFAALRGLGGPGREHEAHDERIEWDRHLAAAGWTCLGWPTEHGGRSATIEERVVFHEEYARADAPARVSHFGEELLGPTLIALGTPEQQRRFLPPIKRVEELWCQGYSEPGAGSDLASVSTTAVRDGDEWVLNGSKVWTTGAWWSDWGLCLARTNWDVPKHRGLTVFIFPLNAPGIEVHRIEMLNGSKEFCQEFLSDVRVPDTDRVGEVDDGWTVGTRWMFHERMLHSSPLVTMPSGLMISGGRGHAMVEVARAAGRLDDPIARDLIGEARMLELVRTELQHRIGEGLAKRTVADQSAAVIRLFGGVTSARMFTIAHELAGSTGIAWSASDGEAAGSGTEFLLRQVSCIGGGTTEMARNVISERVLGMPRERTLDRDVAFRDVPRSRSNQG
jgi:alkylation response protein AidB-like acyl-CoA dehydrogenase